MAEAMWFRAVAAVGGLTVMMGCFGSGGGANTPPSSAPAPAPVTPPPPPTAAPAPPAPPPPKPRMKAGTVREVMRREKPNIRACYEQALVKNPELDGTVKVQLTVAEDGRVTSASIAKGIDPEVDACVLERIEKLQFPESAGVTISYPFRFSTK